ncbi:hypothetical protein KIH74_14750 [Kineosporia sp. J2-2]|uniref:Uncharacterized protein n=1 Tax=Kineosporia corallincola TaxID=2835133 RepID=A0ABS5TGI3_9ACTN|nr:hypothetical protein [Kineosporia corallincola]MBT0770197.1 hypothetical protein [Kineosporia corallincola]
MSPTESPDSADGQDAEDGRRLSLHRLLLRLAGRVPDDEMSRMRMSLADGERGELTDLLGAAIAAGHGDPDVLDDPAVRNLLEREGRAVPAAPVALIPVPMHRFTGRRGGDDAVPDQAGSEQLRLTPADELDQAAVESARRVGDVVALWRVFRRGEAGTLLRVYLCEARAGSDVVEMTAEMQYALEELGERPSRVEVFHDTGETLTAYHEQALTAALPVWAADSVPVRLARVFDGAEESGPYFSDDHLRLTGPDRDRVLAYLRSGTPVLDSVGTMDDVVRPERVACVPVDFRSDRVWVWTEAVAYYLAEYDLAPEPDLMSHILGGPPPVRALGRYDRQRVTAALFAPAEREPVWQAG